MPGGAKPRGPVDMQETVLRMQAKKKKLEVGRSILFPKTKRFNKAVVYEDNCQGSLRQAEVCQRHTISTPPALPPTGEAC